MLYLQRTSASTTSMISNLKGWVVLKVNGNVTNASIISSHHG